MPNLTPAYPGNTCLRFSGRWRRCEVAMRWPRNKAINSNPLTSRDGVGRVRWGEMGKPRVGRIFVDHAQAAFQCLGKCRIARIEHFGVRSTDFETFNKAGESLFQS